MMVLKTTFTFPCPQSRPRGMIKMTENIPCLDEPSIRRSSPPRLRGRGGLIELISAYLDLVRRPVKYGALQLTRSGSPVPIETQSSVDPRADRQLGYISARSYLTREEFDERRD